MNKFILIYNPKTNKRDIFQHFGYNFHKELFFEWKRKNGNDWICEGGGWYFRDNEKMVYYSRSQDFGKFDEDIVLEIGKQKYSNLKVYSFSGAELDEALMLSN